MVILVEQHIIKKSNKLFEQLDHLCFLSKNLYNATLYKIRQHYFETGDFLSFAKVNKIMINEKNPDYYAMNTKVSQQTQKLVDQNHRAFFKALTSSKVEKGKARIPRYLDKDGRQVVMFTNQAISTRNPGVIKLGGTDIHIPTNQSSVQFVRLVPRGNHIVIEIGYKSEAGHYIDNGQYAAIDLGISNLATLTFTDSRPIIFNG